MPPTTLYFDRKAIVAKIEPTPGQDANPSPLADYIEARNLQWTPIDAAFVENKIELPYFGNSPELPVSEAAKLTFDVPLQGCGTAGEAVPYGSLLRACGLGEKLLAAPVVGAAQAGSANTLTLAATASAVDNAYQGMVIMTTGGTGAGQTGYILAYDGATKIATMVEAWPTPPDATTTYSIPAQAVYAPVSDLFESASIYMGLHKIRQKMLFAMGNVKAKWPPKDLPMLSFDFTALYTSPTDDDVPTVVDRSGFIDPLPMNNTWTKEPRLHGLPVNLYALDLDLGQKVIHRDDVIGVEDVMITGRGMSGSINVQAGLIAEKNWFETARLATRGAVTLTHGVAAGARSRLCVPATQVKNPKPESKNGITSLGMALRPVPVNGGDEVFFIFD